MAAKQKPKTLRELVTKAVAGSGLGQTAWCTSKGLNPRLVYRWLAGDVERPRIKTMAALAEALGVDYEVVETAVHAAKNG